MQWMATHKGAVVTQQGLACRWPGSSSTVPLTAQKETAHFGSGGLYGSRSGSEPELGLGSRSEVWRPCQSGGMVDEIPVTRVGHGR